MFADIDRASATDSRSSSSSISVRARIHAGWRAHCPVSLHGRSIKTHRPLSVGPSICSITASTDTSSRSATNEYPPEGPGSDRTHPALTSGVITWAKKPLVADTRSASSDPFNGPGGTS